MDPSTSKFLEARPFAVLPVSPPLAALYATQTPELANNADWCSKCGSYLLNGAAEIRIVHDRKQRALRRTCRGCGWKIETLAGRGYPTSLTAQKANPLPSSPSPVLPAPTPQIPSPSPSMPSSAVPTKARSKKKSGLQMLLSQNRDKETQRLGKKDGEAASGGLAAFLSGL
ncbi:hypothetical protein Hypma_010107 [Hypsizygus marmoreus]|uniref:Uncharacterized protein n=1 Tax=Hypsizygus marmoreus TaxID=39966 RepID=A0A369JV91_HYPMA|nr:hypothetical protein Hypma_010107 [Hypsizygus marmoreus]